MSALPSSATDGRCSSFARAEALDPVGTAGGYDAFVLVEHPLPWPREIADEPTFAPLAESVASAGAAGQRVRVQALLPARDADPAWRRVIVFRRSRGAFTYFARHEERTQAQDVGEVAAALVGREVVATNGTRRETTSAAVSDVLICTHGRRDACCGALGTSFYQAVGGSHAGGVDVRTWRTSHTGGHRFAPTAITFPAGQFWAYLDQAVFERVVRCKGSVDDVVGHYRGSAAMDTPALQAAEREAFRRHGWAWLDYERRGCELTDDGEAKRVRIDYRTPDGTPGSHVASVVVKRFLAVPDCGKPIDEAKKAEPELRVVDFT